MNMIVKIILLTLTIVLLPACNDSDTGDTNTQPIVETTIDTSVAVGTQTSLIAIATDPDGDTLQYAWSITSAPVGSTAALTNADQSTSTFTPDIEGEYSIQLIVSDGTNDVIRTPTIQATPAATVGATVVGVTIESTSDTEQSTVPITFGQVFKPGEILESTLLGVRLAEGTQQLIPSQINGKSTHSDGSLRHAIITARVPTLIPNNPQDIEIVVVDAVPAISSVQLSDLLATNFDGVVSLTVAGTTYTVSIKDLLQNTSPETWLSGSEVTEWIVSAPLKTADGTEHPHLTARFNVRAYAGFDSVRVDVIIENTWSYVANPQNFVYDVNVSLCGNNVYSKTDLTHYRQARWRKTFWCGNEPAVHVKHDIDYLIDSYAVPNYDRSLIVPESSLVNMEASWTGDKIEPMGIGVAQATMGAAGANPGIGPLPRWASLYLLSQDIRAKNTTLGTGDLAGSWNIHYRDKNTGLPTSLDDYPYMTLRGNPSDTRNPATGEYEAFPDCGGDCSKPFIAGSTHQPSFSYLPYLITGDHYHLEELLFWANYNILRHNPSYRGHEKGLLRRTAPREQAWSLRTLAQSAYITPDNHSLKSYFNEKLQHNISWYQEYYIDSTENTVELGFLTNGGAIAYNAGGIAPWQDDFFTWSVGYVTELGFSEAQPILEFKSTFAIERMTNPDFCWLKASSYTLEVRDNKDAPLYTDMAEVYQNSFPQFENIDCDSPEMRAISGDQEGEMSGYAHAPTGYPSNLQIALAALATNGIAKSQEAWNVFNNRAIKPDYSTYPNWAIIPR